MTSSSPSSNSFCFPAAEESLASLQPLWDKRERVRTDFAETWYHRAIQQRYGIRSCGHCMNPEVAGLEYDTVTWLELSAAI